MDPDDDKNTKFSFGEQSVETVFEKEKDKWRSKMGKVFGDSYPFDFAVVYGHEDRASEEDLDISAKESMKITSFERLRGMDDIDKHMEKEFYELLACMENKVATSSLNESLLQRKKECEEVFQQFDKIVTLCEEYFDFEYKDCKNRAKKQSDMQEELLYEVETYLTEVEDAGEKEISILKDNISSYMREVGLSWSNKIDESLNEMDKQPSAMETFCERVEDITSADIRDTFILDQQEVSRLWKKAFDDLLMLSAELKRYRCSYYMSKSKLERAIYWMKRNYRDNMPKHTKTQGQITLLVDKKSVLAKNLKDIEEEIVKEKYEQQNLKLNYYKKIASLHTSTKLAYERKLSRHNQIFEVKKSEIIDILKILLNGDRKIYEELLNMPWISKDLSMLESKGTTPYIQAPTNASPKSIKTLHDDDFAEAFRELVCCGDFEILLNYIANELGYMLDFKWVDYAKETLELKNEIKWLELFKVFKIDFTKDLKDLKKHMTKFCINDSPEATFATSRALDGFLQFVQLKKGTREVSDSNLENINIETKNNKEFLDLVDKATPNPLLWDSIMDLLKKYRVLLQSHHRLISMRSELAKENEELDKYLENYKSY
ncbi:hypothetical protein JTE90_020729 [Oedothorax gibbosus]|uniref:Uncharacterized protein n=1 Tax=Oedothorax gibbosus TaxID=931172 RepID=A0AAV6V6D4_9ARAC|nr:hypothetical protein JTE90_020729 [Oedothorax gibbosus]